MFHIPTLAHRLNSESDKYSCVMTPKNILDGAVPLHYASSMDWLHENSLVSGSCVWRADDGEPWLVTFDFAEVDGRLECVGMRMRSFVEVEQEDEFGSYRAVWPGEVSGNDLIPKPSPKPKMNMLDPESVDAFMKAVEEEEVPPKHPAWQDSDAAGAILGDAGQPWAPEISPRPLRTATLRQLPLAALQAHVRREMSRAWQTGIVAPRTAAHRVDVYPFDEMKDMAGPPLEDREKLSPEREDLEQRTWELLQTVKRSGGWDDDLIRERDELGELFADLEQREGPRPELRRAPHPTYPSVQIDASEFRRLTQQAAGSFNAPGQKTGRPAKYSPAQLELVAKAYREAFTSGSSSPTKDVGKKLHLTRSQAAKLVMRCREPRIGLLAPTKPRQAGGIQHQPSADPDAGVETP